MTPPQGAWSRWPGPCRCISRNGQTLSVACRLRLVCWPRAVCHVQPALPPVLLPPCRKGAPSTARQSWGTGPVLLLTPFRPASVLGSLRVGQSCWCLRGASWLLHVWVPLSEARPQSLLLGRRVTIPACHRAGGCMPCNLQARLYMAVSGHHMPFVTCQRTADGQPAS